MYQPSALRRLWWKYLSLNLPWRNKYLIGRDLEGNLFFSLGKFQSSGRERRMVKYREQKDWASYKLTPQWQAWLRHSRDNAPSLQELVDDEQRRDRTRQLAKIADERWKLVGPQSVERLAVGSSDEALKAIRGNEEPKAPENDKPTAREDDPAVMKRDLPGQDPGTTFQPQEWSGKISRRG